ncbi:pseudouridine synthase [Mucilaginibacter glaciei]|uniref:Pseudouridine synthase n=1 Tax=Mucilaginibacter glaciei TaxID=2772109 RepID=A0A926NN14_9SPHI|nr:pseudouridine synthase [Mucilaginibacter glaciei]MBD1394176.1 pseudouridine synthase [Mucilaginibacter glaciei]
MVFKRPTGSRDDKPNRGSGGPKSGADRSNRSSSSSAGKSFGTGGRSDNKKTFSTDKRQSSAGYAKPDGDSDRPKKSYGGGSSSSFSGGEKKAFVPKGRPYTGRPADSDRPKRSFGDAPAGDRKSFTPRDKPYSGRAESSEGGERPYRKPTLGQSSFAKKTFTPKDKPYGTRPSSAGEGDRTKRSFGSDEKPKRAFGDTSGERKPYNRTPKPGSGTGKKDFANTTSGFKKREEGESDKPKTTMRGRKNPVAKTKDDGLIRLNRYIANAGICSRRKADELIAAGVVSVNGEVINELGHKVDPMKDLVRYNGEALKREKNVYVLLNKPKDYITTTDDPQERRTVMHLVDKASKERIYPVGRLDRNTTGLILMTNDGDLADKLSHPRNSVTKLYLVELNKALTQGDMNKIGFGLELEDGLIKPDSISYVTGGTKKEIGIQIHSGKNRIVRRIFESLGYDVVKLDRSVYANLTKKDLPRGRWRYLDEKEVIQLKHLIQS